MKRVIDSLQFFILVFPTVDDFMFILKSETKHLNKRRDDNGLEDKLTFQASEVLGYARSSCQRICSRMLVYVVPRQEAYSEQRRLEISATLALKRAILTNVIKMMSAIAI